MQYRGTRRSDLPARDGLTLLELIVVVAILAVLAGSAVMVIDQTADDVQRKVGQNDLVEIKKALLQFKLDTGYLPKTGPFALADEGGLLDVNNAAHWPTALWDGLLSTMSPLERADWFRSPANMCQLFYNPLAGAGHPLGQWDPDSGRGWRGPYLSQTGNGFVTVGALLAPNGAGNPAAGAVVLVPGVADSYAAPPVGDYFQWSHAVNGPVQPRWGRPYLLLDLHDRDAARIVGLGPDGIYNGEDPFLYILR